MDLEIDLEVIGSKRFKDCGVYKVWLFEEPKNDLHRWRTSQFLGQIGGNRQMELLIFDQRL